MDRPADALDEATISELDSKKIDDVTSSVKPNSNTGRRSQMRVIIPPVALHFPIVLFSKF